MTATTHEKKVTALQTPAPSDPTCDERIGWRQRERVLTWPVLVGPKGGASGRGPYIFDPDAGTGPSSPTAYDSGSSKERSSLLIAVSWSPIRGDRPAGRRKETPALHISHPAVILCSGFITYHPCLDWFPYSTCWFVLRIKSESPFSL